MKLRDKLLRLLLQPQGILASVKGESELLLTKIPGSIQRNRAGRVLQNICYGRVGYYHPNALIHWLGNLEAKLRKARIEMEAKRRIL